MRIRFRLHLSFIFISICLSSLPGTFSAKLVTLDSIELFNNHEWLASHPTVYFHCQKENKIKLPDVKKTNVVYTFKGAESWQPLTELPADKCKRCGLYEEDTVKSDDIFDEWELCPDDFVGHNGKYVRFKEKEFNLTLSCPQCVPHQPDPVEGRKSKHESGGNKGMHAAIVVLVSALVSIVSVTGMVAAYRYWQRKKREQDQARFLKLFEEGDDIEDELGLGQII